MRNLRRQPRYSPPAGSAKLSRLEFAGPQHVTEENRARRFYVSGIVQGVGYRFFAERTASRLGLAGYAMNLRDGRVEVYAIGPEKLLAELRRELERGPRAAQVDGVAEEDAAVEARFSGGFSIEYE
jgi:acylphosphatase